MKKAIVTALAGAVVGGIALPAQASPEQDLKAFRKYYQQRFPDVKLDDFGNGAYALDKDLRTQWQEIEQFPPYETAIEEGEKLFKTPFANGKSLASCFPGWDKGIRQNYPYFDGKTGKVKTLDLEINECRERNGEKPWDYKKGPMAAVTAFLAYKSRGKKIDIKIPNDKRALAAYEQGKRHFYSKRGQLNLSCANCHVDSAGQLIRADLLSPALGHPTHFPVFRSTWGEIGTLHWRYSGCNEQVRAKPFKEQSDEYRNLEYFHTYMSNGLTVNGPGARK